MKKFENLWYVDLNIIVTLNKFDSICESKKDIFYIYLISETDLAFSFPGNQFSISGYSVLKEDCNKNRTEFRLYINENIPVNLNQISSLPTTL